MTGGKIQTPSGIALEFPPLAVSFDTDVTLKTVSAAQLAAINSDIIAGVILEPNEFQSSYPATLRIPLPPSAVGLALSKLRFRGSDPTEDIESPTRRSNSAWPWMSCRGNVKRSRSAARIKLRGMPIDEPL